MPLFFAVLLSATAHAEDPKPESAPTGGFPFGLDGAAVKPVALLQVWVTAYDMDADAQADSTGYGDPEDDPGIKVKRARFGFGGHIKKWKYRLTVGTSAPYDGLDEPAEPIEVVDAWVGVEPIDGLDIRVGRTKVPFSRDQMMGAGELTFTERGVASEHLVPDRSLGLTGAFGRGGGKATVGIFNSAGDLFGDDTLGKLFVGRVEWDLGKADTYQTWGDRKAFGLGIGANGSYEIGEATDTWAVGGDAMLRVAGVSLLVDGAYAHLAPTATTVESPEVWEETDRWGVTGQVSYQAGPIEPAVRFSMFDDSTLGSYSHLLVGGAWHTAEDHVRVGLGYELRLEGQDPVDNDTARLWAQFQL